MGFDPIQGGVPKILNTAFQILKSFSTFAVQFLENYVCNCKHCWTTVQSG